MLKWVFIAVIIFSIVSFVFVGVNFYFVFRRFETPHYSKHLEYDDIKEQVEREEISFYSGKNKLQGYLYGKDNDKGVIVICHGIFSGARGYLMEAVYFAQQGYQVFSFDYTGYCASEGKSSNSLRQGTRDLDAALTFVEEDERFHSEHLYLYGHSWGGYNVTAILADKHPIDAVVSLSGFDKPADIIIDWAKKEVGPIAVLEYPYVYIVEGLVAGENWNRSAVDAINSCDTPVMIVHGCKDDVVSYGHAGIIAARDKITNPNVSFVVREDEGQNDHINHYRDLDSISYIHQIDREYEELKVQYKNHIPEDVEKKFYDGIDKQMSSKLDQTFMESVVHFYENASMK